MIRSRKQGKSLDLAVSVIPLLDVLLILIVVMVLFTDLSMKKSISVSLPTSDTGSSVYRKSIDISVIENGDIFVDGVKTKLAGIPSALDSAARETVVSISCDRNLRYASVVEIVDIVKGIGFHDIAILTNSKIDAGK